LAEHVPLDTTVVDHVRLLKPNAIRPPRAPGLAVDPEDFETTHRRSIAASHRMSSRNLCGPPAGRRLTRTSSKSPVCSKGFTIEDRGSSFEAHLHCWCVART
jgi:hypothetical protein